MTNSEHCSNWKWPLIIAGSASFVLAALIVGLLYLEARSEFRLTSVDWARSKLLGSVYYVNDIATISPANGSLPAGLILSHSSPAFAIVETRRESMLIGAEQFGLRQDLDIPYWSVPELHFDSGKPISLAYYRSMLVGKYLGKSDLDDNDAESTDRHIKIKFTIPWEVSYGSTGAVAITAKNGRHNGFLQTALLVDLTGPGEFWIEPLPAPSDGFPIGVNLLPGISPKQVAIGGRQTNLLTSIQSITTRDFHAFALGEIDGDDGAEAIVVRGAARGLLDKIWPDETEIVLNYRSDGVNERNLSDFTKMGCPGRQSAWVDIDRDNDLDFYTVCGRSKGTGSEKNNRLYLQYDVGKFSDVAKEWGIAFPGQGFFKFIDWDSDLDPDLFWIDDGDITFYENEGTSFRQKKVLSNAIHQDYRPTYLLIEDVNTDGNPDLFVVNSESSVVVINEINEGGTASAVDSSKYGLPDGALGAAWIDINRDGHSDFFTVNKGSYIRTANHTYEEVPGFFTGALFIKDARIGLIRDSGNNPAIVLALHRCLPGKFCHLRTRIGRSLRGIFNIRPSALARWNLFEPQTWDIVVVYPVAKNWMANQGSSHLLDIMGPTMNPNSIGARVMLTHGKVKTVKWTGMSDFSAYSHAFFSPLFFRPASGEVHAHVYWPDGCEVEKLLSEQKPSPLEIPYPETCRGKNGTPD